MGRVSLILGDYTAVCCFLDESSTLYRELSDEEGIIRSINILGIAAMTQGQYERATTLLQEILVLARGQHNRHRLINILNGLGQVARNQGNYERAMVLYQESLTLAQEEGDKNDLAWALILMGQVAYSQGDLKAARALCERALATDREIGILTCHPWLLHLLGRVAHCEGDLVRARVHLEKSLRVFAASGEKLRIAECLEGLASVAGTQGLSERAARLIGAASSLREAMGTPLPPVDRPGYERDVANARAALGEAALTAAWAQGRAMTLAQAVEYASRKGDDVPDDVGQL
jgi:tetratricopeptide (TPR) repeat protein